MKTFIRTIAYTLSIVTLTLALSQGQVTASTPLIKAIQAADLAKFEQLMAQEADIQGKDTAAARFDEAPLLTAILALKKMVESGKRNEALEENLTTIISKLIEAGANLNERRRYQDAPLLAASTIKDDKVAFKIANLLIKAGANVNLKGPGQPNKRTTALWYAIENDNLDLVKALINANADVTIIVKDRVGPRSMLDAAKYKSKALRDLLTAKGAKAAKVTGKK